MTVLLGELGINFNGDYPTLIQMSDLALDYMDYIKIQMRTPRLCVPKDQWDKPREWFDGTPMTYIEYKEKIEMGDEELDKWFDKYDGRAFASVWDIPSLERLEKYKPPFIKIPSAMLTNSDLINASIDTGIPIILSSGMSEIYEIDAAMKLFPKWYNVILMHCNSSYPAKDEETDLLAMKSLRDRYSVPVGFSSHSPSPYPSLYAMVLGAWGIEVHMTLDRSMKGTDQSASLEWPALSLISRERSRIPQLLGSSVKRVYASELPSRKKLRGY